MSQTTVFGPKKKLNSEKRKDEINSLPVGWSQVVRYIEKHFGSE
jgi:hypothetical protein